MPAGETPASAAVAPDARTEKLNTRAAGVVGLAVLCSRVLGLAREQIFAALFGGGRIMDAFTIAFRIPNLLRDLFAEGALSTAFVTTFSKTVALEGDGAAWRLANKVATLTTDLAERHHACSASSSPRGWWRCWRPASTGDKALLTVTLTRIMYPFILLVSLAALVMGMLNARNVFGIPAMASSFFNLGSIVAGVLLGWWLDPHFGERAILGLAIGTLIGGALQLLVQLPALRRARLPRFIADFRWRDPGVRRDPAPDGAVGDRRQHHPGQRAGQLGVRLEARRRPDLLADASPSALMQLPLGIFGVALGTVALPLLARMAAAGNQSGLPQRAGARHAAGVSHDDPGEHRPHGARRADHLGAVPARSLRRVRDRGVCRCAALLRHRPVRLRRTQGAGERLLRHRPAQDADGGELRGGGLKLLLNWIFTVHLGWGHRGLAFSTACVATSNFLILYLLMRSHLGRLESRAMAVSWRGSRSHRLHCS